MAEAAPPEAVDTLYLKNVVLKFLDAFANGRATELQALLPAVATLLRATPQEFRSLKHSVETHTGWGVLSAIGISMTGSS